MKRAFVRNAFCLISSAALAWAASSDAGSLDLPSAVESLGKEAPNGACNTATLDRLAKTLNSPEIKRDDPAYELAVNRWPSDIRIWPYLSSVDAKRRFVFYILVRDPTDTIKHCYTGGASDWVCANFSKLMYLKYRNAALPDGQEQEKPPFNVKQEAVKFRIPIREVSVLIRGEKGTKGHAVNAVWVGGEARTPDEERKKSNWVFFEPQNDGILLESGKKNFDPPDRVYQVDSESDEPLSSKNGLYESAVKGPLPVFWMGQDLKVKSLSTTSGIVLTESLISGKEDFASWKLAIALAEHPEDRTQVMELAKSLGTLSPAWLSRAESLKDLPSDRDFQALDGDAKTIVYVYRLLSSPLVAEMKDRATDGEANFRRQYDAGIQYLAEKHLIKAEDLRAYQSILDGFPKSPR